MGMGKHRHGSNGGVWLRVNFTHCGPLLHCPNDDFIAVEEGNKIEGVNEYECKKTF